MPFGTLEIVDTGLVTKSRATLSGTSAACFAACVNSLVCDIACSLAIALISATRRMSICVAVGFKNPEVGVDRVAVRAGVSRHGIPHGKVRPLEILRLENHAGVERRQRLVGDRRCGGGWRRRLNLRV